METNKKRRLVIILAIIFILIVGLLIFNFFIFPRLRKQAFQEAGALTPQVTKQENGIYKVDIQFKTGVREPTPIGAVSFKATYDAGNSQTQVVDENGMQTTTIEPSVSLQSSGWTFPVNKVEINGSVVTVDFAAVYTNPEGFSTSDYINLATIYLKSEKEITDNYLKLEFDSPNTVILTKTKPLENIRASEDDLLIY